MLVSLLALLLQDPTVEALIEQWREDDPVVRTRASRDLTGRFDALSPEDLLKLDLAVKDPDAEVAGRARDALERILLRRRLGRGVVDRIRGIDDTILRGSAQDKVRVLKEADRLRREGTLKAADLEGLQELAKGAWNSDEALAKLMDEEEGFEGVAGALVKSTRPAVRVKAAERLSAEGRQNLPQLVPLLRDTEPEVRATALRAIGRWDAREHAAQVAPLLRDERPEIRWEALQTISRWDARDYVREVAGFLRDGDWKARAKAAETLGGWGSKEFARQVAPLLKDPFGPTRAEAASALGEFGAKEWAPGIAALLEDSLPTVRWNAALALGKLGASEFAPRIAALLEDPDSFVRISAAQALGMQGQTRYAGEILSLLQGSDARVRLDAVWVLGRVATKDLHPQVAGLLESGDSTVRHDALWLLERLEAVEYRGEMLRMLGDTHGWVRSRAVRALARVGGGADAGALAPRLRDEDRRTRIFAALALGELGRRVVLSEETVRLLVEAEGGRDRVLGLAASTALIGLGRRDRAAQKAALEELMADDVAAPFLGAEFLDALNRVNEKDTWERLERAVDLDRTVETWADVDALARTAGLRLEVAAGAGIGRLAVGPRIPLRRVLEWALGRTGGEDVVLEARKVRVLYGARGALAYWRTRLEGK